MLSRIFELSFQIFRLFFSISKELNDQAWLQKLSGSKIIGRTFATLCSNLHLGMIIYTLTSDDHLIPTSSLMAYESETMAAFAPDPGNVVVDIGAYVGRYSLRASKKVGNSGIVIAIEPDPRAYRVLAQNLAFNRARNVRSFNLAISNHDGTCELQIGKPGFTSLEKETFEASHIENKKTREITVVCRTLNSLLDELDIKKVDWIKVDVEGAEYQVLQGMLGVLNRNDHVKCVFEIHHANGVDKVKPELRKMGFELFDVSYAHILASRSALVCP